MPPRRMCHDQDNQNIVNFPIKGDGHRSTNRLLYTHSKDSHYGMDDHKPDTMFSPLHIPANE